MSDAGRSPTPCGRCIGARRSADLLPGNAGSGGAGGPGSLVHPARHARSRAADTVHEDVESVETVDACARTPIWRLRESPAASVREPQAPGGLCGPGGCGSVLRRRPRPGRSSQRTASRRAPSPRQRSAEAAKAGRAARARSAAPCSRRSPATAPGPPASRSRRSADAHRDGRRKRLVHPPPGGDPERRLPRSRGSRAAGSRLVAFDVLGSGVGERVLVAQGSVAAAWFPGKAPPIDALIVGSIDDRSQSRSAGSARAQHELRNRSLSRPAAARPDKAAGSDQQDRRPTWRTTRSA